VVALFVGGMGGIVIALGLAHLANPDWFLMPEGATYRWWANWRTNSTILVRIRGVIAITLGVLLILEAVEG
jgi:hypothetical protein